jgi:hypothetical protein
MSGWMPSARCVPAPSARRQLLRSLAVAAAVVSGAVAPAVLPGAVAAADEPAGTTVVGELVQAWAEAAPAEAAAGHGSDGHGSDGHGSDGHGSDGHGSNRHGADGLISWVQPAEGAPVLIDTEGVDGVPAGSTVSVTVGTPSEDSSDEGEGAPLPVRDTTVVAPPVVGPAPAPARITNTVTVAMVAPAGANPAGDGTTLAQVVSAVNDRVAPFWSEQSDGAISLGVTATHDWIPAAVDCAKPGLLWDDIAARVNFEPGPGKHLLLYVSRDSNCGYALAEVGLQPSSGGRLYVRDTTTSVIAHEFGHNFGLGHSSAEQCDGAVEGGSCRTVAYRDYYDVMGVSWSQTGTLNAAQAALLKVLPEAQQQSVSVRGSATTATLSPLSGRTGTRALRLTDADGLDYWLEYRTATDRDSWLAAPANRFGLESGVLLRRSGGLPDTSVLLDGTPTAAAGWDGDYHATLPVGVAVPVSGGDFSLVVQSVSAAGAVVSVTPTPPVAGSAPAPATPPAPRGGVMAGTAAEAPVPAPAAADAVGFWAPTYSGTVPRSTPVLDSASDAATGGGFLVAGAGTLLAGATLLFVRRLRSATVRSR